jgi:hypothetical protein
MSIPLSAARFLIIWSKVPL